MKRSYILTRFARYGYKVVRDEVLNAWVIHTPNAFIKAFRSLAGAYRYYFVDDAVRIPKVNEVVKISKEWFYKMDICDMNYKDLAQDMIKDLNVIIEKTHKIPNTLYRESYHFCNLVRHVLQIARAFDLVEELRPSAPWLFA